MRSAREPAPDLVSLISGLAGQGLSLREIARRLNRLNLRTARGKEWYAATVRTVLASPPVKSRRRHHQPLGS
jgi:hypothetical protein